MCDVLDGGEFVGVLNAPNMAFARKSKLSSYVKLGEKMGALQAQLLGHGKVSAAIAVVVAFVTAIAAILHAVVYQQSVST
jgi:hypothetical protein